jgi:hypothetical protein
LNHEKSQVLFFSFLISLFHFFITDLHNILSLLFLLSDLRFPIFSLAAKNGEKCCCFSENPRTDLWPISEALSKNPETSRKVVGLARSVYAPFFSARGSVLRNIEIGA